MRKSTATISCFLLGIFVGICAGYVWGIKAGMFESALQENKVAVANLRLHATDLAPQLAEYLKARIYSNVFTYYPKKPGYLIQKDWDCGAVDGKVLGKIRTSKDPHQAAWDWSMAVKEK